MCFFIFFFEVAPVAAGRLGPILPEQVKAKNPQGVWGTEFPDSVNKETKQ